MYKYAKCFLVLVFVRSGFFISTKLTTTWNRRLQNPNYDQNPGYPVSDVQVFMEALDSLATNDELRCVPKLVCEVTSGSKGLPFNVDLNSILELLSSLEGAYQSPLVMFGKAAVLGYTSKGNPASCMYAYPRCPRNPDVLINYLNNHNGGFFRLFDGDRKKAYAEKRILTKPSHLVDDDDNYFRTVIKFPVDEGGYDYKLYFPTNENNRYPKALSFPTEPLPNRMIFPDRTGTGELLVDTENFYRSRKV